MPRELLMTPVPADRRRAAGHTAHKRKPAAAAPELTNIVKIAIRIIAGPDSGEVARAARVVGVSEPTMYRWRQRGNLLEARGSELLRVHELTGLPMELLLKG